MRTLPDVEALLVEAAGIAPGHPWPRVCAAPFLAFGGGWAVEGALAWRGGHPWGPRADDVHGVGRPEAVATLIGRLARTGDHLIASPRALLASGRPVRPARRWWLREINAPIARQPGQQQVAWLAPDAGEQVGQLLDLANPGAAFRPADPGAGRWCGIWQQGRLVAAACETWPDARIAHLSSLAVHPEARRQGLGAAVTSFFVAEALAGGAPSVILGVDHDNGAGGALYDRLGFSAWPMAGFDPG